MTDNLEVNFRPHEMNATQSMVTMFFLSSISALLLGAQIIMIYNALDDPETITVFKAGLLFTILLIEGFIYVLSVTRFFKYSANALRETKNSRNETVSMVEGTTTDMKTNKGLIVGRSKNRVPKSPKVFSSSVAAETAPVGSSRTSSLKAADNKEGDF